MTEKKVLGGCDKVKVAVVQAAPVFFDKQRTLEKACRLIEEAGKNGARLIVFPEAFVSGYPAIYTGGWESKVKEWAPYMLAFQDGALVVNSSDTEILGKAAKAAGAYVVVGCNELDDRPGSRTVYNTMVFLDAEGSVMGRHRKLIVTYTERTYYGTGDAADIRVFETDIGRIGGLICGENMTILLKAAMMQQGEEIHVMNWPGVWAGHNRVTILDPETDPKGGTSILYPVVRTYALESQSFVVSANGILRDADFPDKWRSLKGNNHASYAYAIGGSSVAGPSGHIIAGPAIGDENILYAECGAYQIKLAKAVLDCLGHYTRWDVVSLQVRKAPWGPPVEVPRPPAVSPAELRRLCDKYEVDQDKLEAILAEMVPVL